MTSTLATVSRSELLARLHELVRRGNALEAELLAHLAEVDARRLYLDEGCSSMFAYCQRVLHFAESVAYKRIQAARVARRHPEILVAVRRGELHVTGVSLLAPWLDSTNATELIHAARHRSADEIRRLLADRNPRPDVPASMRRVPLPVETLSASAAGPGTGPPAPSTLHAPAPSRHRAEPLGGGRYHVQFTADREVYGQLQELRALMRHQIPDGDLGKILGRAVGLLLRRVRKRKFAETRRPKAGSSATRGRPRPTRHIPAAIRRAVWKRDGGRCTFVSTEGRRCGAQEFLEFDHIEAWQGQRSHSLEGITLRCHAHNQHRARHDFGEQHMARFTKKRGSEQQTGQPAIDSQPDLDQAREQPTGQPATDSQPDLDQAREQPTGQPATDSQP
ncbi:MAG: hypothetical protein QNK04_33320, partial [Myxococcota bacterium]|nr:hypothetical protein [Myxococcota bacterium]